MSPSANPDYYDKTFDHLILEGKPTEARISESRETEDYEKHERDRKRLRNKNLKQNIRLRKEFANKIHELIYIWIVFVILFMALYVLGPFSSAPSKVVITLLATTTVNIVGVFAIVVKYLFPESSQQID